MILDDLYRILVEIPIQMAIAFIQALIMPFVFCPLYFLILVVNNLINLGNMAIGLVNIVVVVPNMMTLLMSTYFYNIPGIWATPLIAGITMRFYYSSYSFIKRHIPTLAGGTP